ncbi:MAG: hypothetical protein CFE34_00135 [Rhodobacteraceae bacterium PARR1]|nr:MAG: hypothetical protein CFE34_00135 [Rhodobacteraceae bacterium PARR1]
MSVRIAVLLGVKVAICLAYLSNVVSIAGIAPLFVFAPFLLALAVIQLIVDPPTGAVPATSQFIKLVLLGMILSALLTPVFFGLDGNRPRAVLFATLLFSIVLILGRTVQTLDDMRGMLNLIRRMTIVLVAIGTVEIFTGWHLPNSRHFDLTFFYTSPYIPTGTVYNENQFASLVLLGIPLFLSSVFGTGSVFNRLAYVFVLLVSIFTITQTDSRLNLIGLMLVVTSFLALSGFKRSAGGLVLAIFLVFLLIALQPELVTSVFDEISSQLSTLSLDTFVKTDDKEVVRLNLLIMALDVIAEYPIFGYGAGGAEVYCEAGNYFTYGVCAPHNWPLELASSFGLPLAILHICSVIGLFVALLRIKADPQLRATMVALFSTTVTANFTASSILLLTPVWVVFGLLVAYVNFMYRTEGKS